MALTAGTTFMFGDLSPALAGTGIYGGGANLFSLAFRALADCYHGKTPTGALPSPKACATAGRPNLNVEALYAGVNSAAARRAIIPNDSRQLLGGSVSPVLTPNALPAYLDTTGFLPKKYPYPELDFGVSDDPLPVPLTAVPWTGFNPASGWETIAGGLPAITVVAGAATTYNQAKLGAAIQVPAAEVGVAIIVNAPKPSAAPWQIAYQGNNVLHLSQPQICAIFAAAVTNWNDSATSIAYRDSSGALQSELFSDGNAPTGSPYAGASLPITVVYRGDNAGTTFILANFLSSVCPFFDDGANQYQKIFAPTAANIAAGYKELPSGNFSDLIANIQKAFPARAATTATWIAQTSNGGVAAAVSNYTANPGLSGRFSYVASSYTQPYSKLANAPLAAAVQDEAQRLAGVYHASPVAPFIAPAPGALDLAWRDLPVPTLPTYTAWDVYTPTHAVFGGLQKSILATPTRVGAYPLTGTAFLLLYSCYADTTGARVPALTDFLSWYFGGATISGTDYPAGTPATTTRNAPKVDPYVKALLKLNGFSAVPRNFARTILSRYVINATPPNHFYAIEAFKPGSRQANGCRGVTGGGAL